MFSQALRAEREVEQGNIDAEWGKRAEPERQAESRQHREQPADNASQSGAVVQAFFQRRHQVAETDQRMKARYFTQQAVEQHGGERCQRHGKRG